MKTFVVKMKTGREDNTVTIVDIVDSGKLIYYLSNQSRIMRNKSKS